MAPNDSPRRRALTLWPEWAWAICRLGKDRENRTWEPPPYLIGDWMAIHAGRHIGGKPGDNALLDGLTDLREMVEFVEDEQRVQLGLPVYSELIPQISTSAIVAICRVMGSQRGSEPAGWYNGVPNVGWVLADVRVLPAPVPCKGAQGLWLLPDEVLFKVREQFGNRSAGSLPRQERPYGA